MSTRLMHKHFRGSSHSWGTALLSKHASKTKTETRECTDPQTSHLASLGSLRAKGPAGWRGQGSYVQASCTLCTRAQEGSMVGLFSGAWQGGNC